MRIRRVGVWKHERFTIIPRKRCADCWLLITHGARENDGVLLLTIINCTHTEPLKPKLCVSDWMKIFFDNICFLQHGECGPGGQEGEVHAVQLRVSVGRRRHQLARLHVQQHQQRVARGRGGRRHLGQCTPKKRGNYR